MSCSSSTVTSCRGNCKLLTEVRTSNALSLYFRLTITRYSISSPAKSPFPVASQNQRRPR